MRFAYRLWIIRQVRRIKVDGLYTLEGRMSVQVSHPYKTTGKIKVLYTLIFNFWIADWKTEDSAPNNSKNSPISFKHSVHYCCQVLTNGSKNFSSSSQYQISLRNTFSSSRVLTCAQTNGAISVLVGNHQGCGRV